MGEGLKEEKIREIEHAYKRQRYKDEKFKHIRKHTTSPALAAPT